MANESQPNQNEPPIVGITCASCGAICVKDVTNCWMCGHDPRVNPFSAHAAPIAQAPVEYAGNRPVLPPVASGRFEILFRVLSPTFQVQEDITGFFERALGARDQILDVVTADLGVGVVDHSLLGIRHRLRLGRLEEL